MRKPAKFLGSRPHLIPALAALAALALSLFGQQMVGGPILLWIVFLGSVATLVVAFENQVGWAIGVFLLLAILFNPFYRFRIDDEIWQFVKLAAMVPFAIAAFSVRRL